MNELLVDMKNKYPTFDITSQHFTSYEDRLLEITIKQENEQGTSIFQKKDTKNQ